MLYDTVMAMEARDLSLLDQLTSDDEMEPTGLCNALIFAQKAALFLQRWLETYEGF